MSRAAARLRMNLSSRFEKTISEQGFSPDPAQAQAIKTLNRIANELTSSRSARGWLSRIRRRFIGRRVNSAPVRGAYLWGGVGRGKTFMMDFFFESLPFDDKLRFHFHRLMYRVHGRLKTLQKNEDPLEMVADELADQAQVICFDEFYVSDIADAMILGRLLDALFRRQVTLVATSNIAPPDLYSEGLQRQRFLPAIDLLNAHTEILHIDGDQDYRLRVLENAEIYHSSLDAAATEMLADTFRRIAPDAGTTGRDIEVLGRNIPTCKRADGIVWFSFRALCDGPRSQDDYIEIARCFQTIILSDVPVLDEQTEDQARRFVAAVDEFYDRKVNLIVSAEKPIDGLYVGSRLEREFERTRSRLLEMQSTKYLAAAHLP